MKNLVVVNADDLGLSREINEGIFTGLEQGVISDASILIDAPFARDALHRLEKAGLSRLGIHVNLDGPFGWDLPGQERYPRTELLLKLGDRRFLEECRGQARGQIERFLAAGLVPTHVDTHHHVHGFYPVFMILVSLAREYSIPAMRYSRSGYTLSTRRPVPFDPDVQRRMKEMLDREGICSCSEMLEGAGLLSRAHAFPAELVVHPSLGGDEWRRAELQTLCSEEFREEIAAAGVRLVSFGDLAGC